MSARRVWARSFWLCIPWGLCHPTQLFTWLEVNAAVSRTALPVSHRSLGARRDCPLCGRALPLFKVVCTRLDILCLQHEPGVFQDCLAHLQRSHTAEKTRSLIDLPSFPPSPGLGPEALGNLEPLSYSKLVKIRKAGKGRSTVLCHWWKRSQETVTVKALRMFIL